MDWQRTQWTKRYGMENTFVTCVSSKGLDHALFVCVFLGCVFVYSCEMLINYTVYSYILYKLIYESQRDNAIV